MFCVPRNEISNLNLNRSISLRLGL
jgi:hypothetical protein